MTTHKMVAPPTAKRQEAATRALHEAPCPGCGLEPDVTTYWQRAGLRVGYVCSCGASVIDGLMVGVQ